MTDDELLKYLGLPDGPDERLYVASLSRGHLSAYERMREAEEDIALWQAGVGPVPRRVIICKEHH
jgi:hypothetical protein